MKTDSGSTTGFDGRSVKDEDGRQGSPSFDIDWQSAMEQELQKELERASVSGTSHIRLTDARSARADYVFELANQLQTKMANGDKDKSLSSSDRSLRFGRCFAMNAERSQMWKNITEKVNERFGELLGICDVDQIKKVYTNRLSRPKKRHSIVRVEDLLSSSTVDQSDHSSPSQVIPSTSYTPPIKKKLKTPDSSTTSEDKLPLFSNAVDVTEDKMTSLLRAFDRSDEITQLKEQLLEKDKEIERLKKTMLEMSDSHVRRMDAVMDMVKRALRDEVAADVVNALQLH